MQGIVYPYMKPAAQVSYSVNSSKYVFVQVKCKHYILECFILQIVYVENFCIIANPMKEDFKLFLNCSAGFIIQLFSKSVNRFVNLDLCYSNYFRILLDNALPLESKCKNIQLLPVSTTHFTTFIQSSNFTSLMYVDNVQFCHILLRTNEARLDLILGLGGCLDFLVSAAILPSQTLVISPSHSSQGCGEWSP